MKLTFKRCLICLGWYSPKAHCGHCPNCGAYPIGAKHFAISLAGECVRELRSAAHMPIALRANYYNR